MNKISDDIKKIIDEIYNNDEDTSKDTFDNNQISLINFENEKIEQQISEENNDVNEIKKIINDNTQKQIPLKDIINIEEETINLQEVSLEEMIKTTNQKIKESKEDANQKEKDCKVYLKDLEKEIINTEVIDFAIDDENKIKEKNIFKKILSKFMPKVDNIQEDLQNEIYNSKFKEFIFLVGEEEEEEEVLEAIKICDEIIKINLQVGYYNKKRKEFETVLEDMKCYDNLTQEDTQKFKDLVNKFLALTVERKGIRCQMSDFNGSIDKLDVLEQDAKKSMLEIEEAEKNKKLFTRDIMLIEDEKQRTLNDRENLKIAGKVIYGFSISLVIFSAISVVMLTLMSSFYNQNIIVLLTGLFVIVIISSVIIYAVRQKIIFEVKLNKKKYIKLVQFLNKKRIVYSHYANFLNFVYKKYNVKDAKTLRNNLNDFENYRNTTARYDNLGRIVMEVKIQLEEFIQEKNINVYAVSLEAFAKSINVDDKIAKFKNILSKKQNMEGWIKRLEEEQKTHWEKLLNLNDNDKTEEKVIEKVVEAYTIEAGRLLSVNEEEYLNQFFKDFRLISIEDSKEDEIGDKKYHKKIKK